MKKIIFVINSLSIGGIQKSLVELINVIKDKYEVTLYCVKQGGECESFLPKDIKIIYGNKWALVSEQSLAEARKSGFAPYLLRFFLSFWTKLFGKKIPAYLLTKIMGKISGEYDAAISFSQPIHDKQFATLTNEIVLNCCKAKRKITFLHCDFIEYGGNTKYNRGLYKKFDAVAAVSNSVGECFLRVLPELKEKLFTVYNCVDNGNIMSLANDNPLEYNKKAIVTVARLSEEKGLLRCIPIFKRLKNEGINVQWHIGGGGPLENSLRRIITDMGLIKDIILHGEQKNPYRFLKNATFFLLPSFHEAAPVVFFEAATLNVPVLTTNTLSAKELVEERYNGMVCDNDDESIYLMIKRALSNSEKCYECKPNDNSLAVNQFDNIIG